MSNPFRPKYTVYQNSRVYSGRKRLLERWATAKFTAGHARTFRVEHRSEEIDDDGRLVDVFHASGAAAAFPSVWIAEIDSHNFTVEHGARMFTVRVPHDFYMKTGCLPCSTDTACLLTTIMNTSVAAILLFIAAQLA